MSPANYPIRSKRKPSVYSTPKERPCKRCYALMVLKDGVWTCKKHGPDSE